MPTAAELIAGFGEVTAAASAALLLVLLLRQGLRRAFGAGVAYAAWALVPAAIVAVLVPAAVVVVTPSVPAAITVGTRAPAAATVIAPSIDWIAWAPVAWLAGTLAMAAWLASQQLGFRRGLGRLRPRGDGLHQADATAGLPAAIGLWRPRIVVPADFDARYSEAEQRLMRAHEHSHIRRGDLHFNALVALLRCLLWFNPLVHYAARRFRHDQELACDQRVIARHPQSRRAYGEAMFKTSSRRSRCRSAATGVTAIHSGRESRCSSNLFRR